MPSLKQVLVEHPPDNKDFRMLRGKTFECISIIGVAVGKQKFGPDALQVMETMTIVQNQTKLADDDPQRSYMLQAWARICKCLGQDFVPFLEHVMPSLLEACDIQAEKVVGDDQEEIELDEEEEALAIDSSGKHVVIKTALLEDKAMACQMMKCIVHDIKEGCFRYIEPITKVMGPLATGSLHEGIRQSAIACLPDLILATARGCSLQGGGEGGRAPVKQLLEYSLGQLLAAMEGEEDMEVLMTAVQATKQCIMNAAVSANEGERLSTAVLNGLQLQKVMCMLLHVLILIPAYSGERVCVRSASSALFLRVRCSVHVGDELYAFPRPVQNWQFSGGFFTRGTF
jgi:hypothetical protein